MTSIDRDRYPEYYYAVAHDVLDNLYWMMTDTETLKGMAGNDVLEQIDDALVDNVEGFILIPISLATFFSKQLTKAHNLGLFDTYKDDITIIYTFCLGVAETTQARFDIYSRETLSTPDGQFPMELRTRIQDINKHSLHAVA